MTWLADEKDAVKDPVTQDPEYLTSQCNGLHFGGRRRDRGREVFKLNISSSTHMYTVPEGLAASLLYNWSPLKKKRVELQL